MSEYAEAGLPSYMRKLMAMDNFSNGRDIDTWVGRCVKCHNNYQLLSFMYDFTNINSRVYTAVANRRFNNKSPSDNLTSSVQIEDLETSLDSILKERAVCL